MSSFFKLYRSIQKHWLWEKKPFSEGQAWIDLLMMANYHSSKAPVNGSILGLKRGEILTSIKSLTKRWGWSFGKCSRFLEILSKDEMLAQKRTPHYTLITLLNYDKYQDQKNDDGKRSNIPRKTLGYQTETSKKNKEIKESNRTIARPPSESRALSDFWMKSFQDHTGEKYPFTSKDGVLLSRILKTYGLTKTQQLISAFFQSPDPFLKTSGWSVGVFSSQLPKLISVAARSGEDDRAGAFNAAGYAYRRRD